MNKTYNYICYRCRSCIHRYEYEKDTTNKYCKDCFKIVQKVNMQNYERDESANPPLVTFKQVWTREVNNKGER